MTAPTEITREKRLDLVHVSAPHGDIEVHHVRGHDAIEWIELRQGTDVISVPVDELSRLTRALGDTLERFYPPPVRGPGHTPSGSESHYNADRGGR